MLEFLAPDLPDHGRQLLMKVFQAHRERTGQSISLICHNWQHYRRELVNVCIHHSGGDIAEVGSTWLSSMVSMNCLRPFSVQELQDLGGRGSFFGPLWQDITVAEGQKTWGLPFRADARVIFYWEDLLESAKVDPASAFGSFDSIQAAFEKLQSYNITPWVVVTQVDNHDSVYNLSSWIHRAGGSFLTPSGKASAFATSEAIDGIQAYFDLYRYMPQNGHPFNDDAALGAFARREVAATMGGPWLLNFLRNHKVTESDFRRLKIALPPGPSFVGGTVLVVFQHAGAITALTDLLKMLYEPEFLSNYCLGSGLLPVQKDMWTEAYLQTDPNLHLFREAISHGTSLPDTPYWGMIEDRLTVAIGDLWREIYSSPGHLQPNVLRDLVAGQLEPVAQRLDLTLGD